MARVKKYTIEIIQKNATWTAKIHRRISVKKSTVSKKQSDFTSEKAANEWAITELEVFTSYQHERNEKNSKKRDLKQEIANEKAAVNAEKKKNKRLNLDERGDQLNTGHQ